MWVWQDRFWLGLARKQAVPPWAHLAVGTLLQERNTGGWAQDGGAAARIHQYLWVSEWGHAIPQSPPNDGGGAPK